MMSGAIIVPPAIATPCCIPETIVWPHGSRSSGMITPVVFSFPLWKIALSRFRNRGRRHIPPSFEQRAQPDAQLDNEQGYELAANCDAGVPRSRTWRLSQH